MLTDEKSQCNCSWSEENFVFDERLEIVHCYTEIHVPAHTKTSIIVILSGFLLNWDLHWIFTSVIINSAAADKERQEPSLDQRVIETLITWNVLSIVLNDKNWTAPKILFCCDGPGSGVEGWWGRNVGRYCVAVIDVFLIVMFHS